MSFNAIPLTTSFFFLVCHVGLGKDRETRGPPDLPANRTCGCESTGSSAKIWFKPPNEFRDLDPNDKRGNPGFGEERSRSGRCGAEAGYSGRKDGDEADPLSLLKKGWDTIPLACDLTRSEPKRDGGFDGGVDGAGDPPSSWMDMVVGVVVEEQVLEEHILGRDRSVRESPGLRRASVSGIDADEK